jgi:hypothetical protein
MRARVFLSIILLAWLESSHGQPALDEIGVADTLAPDFAHADWQSLPAAYVAASGSVERRMDQAVSVASNGNDLFCLREASCAWLKSASSRLYLRAILGSGRLSMDGFVCPRTPGIPPLKYYSTIFVDRGECLPVFWDAQAREYTVNDR